MYSYKYCLRLGLIQFEATEQHAFILAKLVILNFIKYIVNSGSGRYNRDTVITPEPGR